MPTYEYECDHCGHTFEKFQQMVDPLLKRCPKCAHKVKRLLGTGAGIIFKGSGFYQTDYRSDGYKSSAGRDKPLEKPSTSESKSEPKSASKDTTKGESKRESKSPAKSSTKSKSGSKKE